MPGSFHTRDPAIVLARQSIGEIDFMDISRLLPVKDFEDIPFEYEDTPIGLLLAYHNLGRPLDSFSNAQLLIGMCMDHRIRLRTPDNFAYVIRTGGANMQQSGFQIAYALAVGGVKAIAIIGHTRCGMVNLNARRDQFVQGLAEIAGWETEKAEKYFRQFAPRCEIGNELEFVVSDVNRLRLHFPNIFIAPLLYRVEDHLLYMVRES